MTSRKGKTGNTDSPISRNDEETKDGSCSEVKLTRNSIRSNRASIDQKTSNMDDAKYIVHKKPVKTRKQTNQDNQTFDERIKPVTRSQTTQKDLYSDGDDDNNDDDDEAKQNPRVSPPKTPSIGDYDDDDDDYDNEDDGEYKPIHLIPQERMDCKKAGMKNNKNLFSDDDEDSDRKLSLNLKTSSSGTSWYSNKLKTIFSILVAPVILVIAAFLAEHYGLYGAFRSSENNSNALRHFQNHFNALESSYSSQSEDLWKRTRRSLELHLNKSESNTQPVIILLTAAHDAERTMQCLSSQLAKVYSASRNNSYMVISGANKTFQNSESAKLAIDNMLASGFQDTSSAAVLQHIESLHPGALLILYKYCDHENAAFKNVALVLNVLLKDSKLERQLSLKEIEEKVRDFLTEKMISPKSTESHSEMDADKLSGVWSRISHTVLPVYPEDTFGDCGGIEQGL